MKTSHLTPIVLFCVVFLIYSIYFVKVIQIRPVSPPEESAVIELVKEGVPPGVEKLRLSEVPASDFIKNIPQVFTPAPPSTQPVERKQYVNFGFLNVRSEPTTASEIVEVLNQSDAVQVMEYTSTAWAHVQTASGNLGYVSRGYLSDTPVEVPYSSVVRVPVILYHHVTDAIVDGPEILVLPTKNFYSQLKYLSDARYNTLTFADLAQIKASKSLPPQNSVILSFDDGYSDHYQVAKDLKSKNMKGVFFLVTDMIGQPGYLTWHQIREMVEWGMEVGSQGKTHAYLGNAASEQIRLELEESKNVMEAETGQKVIAYAYPSGDWTTRTLGAAQEAGYEFARTMVAGDRYNLNNPYKIPALRVLPLAAERQMRAWLE